MDLVMESGGLYASGIIRRGIIKRTIVMGNAQKCAMQRKTRNKGTVLEMRVYYFLLNSTAEKLLMTKKYNEELREM